MPGRNHLLVVSHDPQIWCWAPVAQGVAARLGVEAVAWVQGEHDRRLAADSGCYARVVDLLAGLDAGRARADAQQNLARITQYEERAGGPCFHEDVAIDRHVARIGWGLPRIIHFAAHIMRAIDQDLARHGLPVAALGEANTLPYRLAYRILRPHLYYCYPNVERTWGQRFYVDQSISAMRPDCGRRYQQFMDQGVPRELERVAAGRLAEFRKGAQVPCYSRGMYGPGATRRGTDPLLSKLSPRHSAASTSRWVKRLLEGDPNDPRDALVRSPLVKLVTTGLEYTRKLAFEEFARPMAEDGMEYCSYFLQVEPEYSVEGLAFEFRNQLATIQNLASLLPGNMRLYVKEHRPMLGLRPRSFYQFLAAIPNVSLLTDDVTSHEIVLGSRAVFTLTGTPGLEAMLNGVPAVVLGRIYFQSFHGIYPARSPRQLRATIGEILAREDAGADDRAAMAALAATYASSFPGKELTGYAPDEVLEPDNVRLLTEGTTEALLTHGAGPKTLDG